MMEFNQGVIMATKEELKKAADLLNANAPPGERLVFVNAAEEKMLKDAGGAGIPAAGEVPSYIFGALLAGLGGAILGSKMGGGSQPQPQQQPYGESLEESLRGQMRVMPEYYESEAEWRPQFADLETDILGRTLLGQQGRSNLGNVVYWT